MNDLISQRFKESIFVKEQILKNAETLELIETAADMIAGCLKEGGKIVICGNGGSASDALHFVSEIIGRFQEEREPWPAIALNADVASMTAIANDYGYNEIFVRQAKAYLKEKDLLIALSTSGNSQNVLRAVKFAREKGNKVVALLGGTGGLVGKVASQAIMVPSNCTARIQECHITIIHILCELTELKLMNMG